ncbi:MAG: hypothetical protein EOO02_05705 [Chitinophagaceae bacterium]|nr:MAG: hypothetical protein EOO02_05705 [Chitinophagaceae bacterium]
MRRTALIIIAVLIAGLGVTIYLMYTHEPADNVSGDPDYTVTSSGLIAAFERDSSAASVKYLNKVIQCRGTVKMLDTSGSLVLTPDDGTGEIIVAIDSRYTPALKQTEQGSVITIQGICSGYSRDEASEDDLLSGLGTTIRLRSAGIKQ